MIATLIPARGGSERIPRKNLAKVGGVTLIARAIELATEAGVDRVWCSTDDAEIAEEAVRAGALIHRRDPVDANGRQPPDRVIELWWRSLTLAERPDAFALQQCTAPLLTPKDIRACFDLLPGREVAYTAVESHALHFGGRLRAHASGDPMLIADRPVGYRPRVLDPGYERRASEFGGCWALTRAHWEQSHSRDAHPCRASQVIVDRWRAIDIDDADDLEMVRALVAWRGWP